MVSSVSVGVDGVIAQLQEEGDGFNKWIFYDDDFDDAASSEVCACLYDRQTDRQGRARARTRAHTNSRPWRSLAWRSGCFVLSRLQHDRCVHGRTMMMHTR